MGYLPIFVSVSGRRCVIVGGGEVAERKVRALLDAGAEVRVVSPALTPGLDHLAATRAIEHRARRWQSGDLDDCVLAFAATDDPQLHRAIAAEARSLKIPINVADEPDLCDFIAPSVVRRGELQIAISTSGASPALAARIRRDLEAILGPEYEAVAQILRAARSYLRAHESDAYERARTLQAIAFSAIAEMVRDNDWPGVDRLLREHLGAGLEGLGIRAREISGNV